MRSSRLVTLFKSQSAVSCIIIEIYIQSGSKSPTPILKSEREMQPLSAEKSRDRRGSSSTVTVKRTSSSPSASFNPPFPPDHDACWGFETANSMVDPYGGQ